MVKNEERDAWLVAARQAGYLTRRQALACGMSEAMIRARVRSGTWRRVKSGLYLLPGHAWSWRGLLAAATAALGAVVSHQSAAEVHDIPHVHRGLAVVTVPIRSTNRFPDVIVHQSTDLSSHSVVEVGHLPVTTPLRTVIDMAAIVGVKRLGRIIDRCLADRRFTLEELQFEVELLSRRGKPGMRRLHTVLAELDPGQVPTESDLEYRVLEFLRTHGFPEPARQYPLPWRASRKGRVDFAYPDHKLIIEVDGRAWHTLAAAFDADRMRDNHAQLAGWRVIRVTHRMLVDRPLEIARLVAEALDPTPPIPRAVEGGPRRPVH